LARSAIERSARLHVARRRFARRAPKKREDPQASVSTFATHWNAVGDECFSA
jgi:hypothetical protein